MSRGLGALETFPVVCGRSFQAGTVGEDGEVLQRSDIPRIQQQRLLIIGDGQLRDPDHEIRLGEIVVKRSLTGLDQDCAFEKFGGRDWFVSPQQQCSQVVERLRVVLIERADPQKPHDRRIVVPLLGVQAGQQEVGLGIRGVRLQRELYLECGLVTVALHESGQRVLVVGILPRCWGWT